MLDNDLLLLQKSVFTGITTDEINAMLSCLSAREAAFQKDEIIFSYGQNITSIGIVLEGNVHIIKEDFWGNRSILAEIGKEDMFAETYSCIGGEPLSVSVEAREACSCLFLDLGRMTEEGSAVNVRLASNLIKILARKNLILTKKAKRREDFLAAFFVCR